MMTLDPAPYVPYGQPHPRAHWWLTIRPLLPLKKDLVHGTGTKFKKLTAALQAQDWGTPEVPGDAWWALRALLTQVDQSMAAVRIVGTFLAAQPEPLPAFLADLWAIAHFRQKGLEALSEAVVPYPKGPTPDEAQVGTRERQVLLGQLLRHWPDLARWTCENPEVRVGVDAQGQAYPGRHWTSWLAKLIPARPNPRLWPGVADLVLATDPLRGLTAQERQDTYGQVALRHPGLLDQMLARSSEIPFEVIKPYTKAQHISGLSALMAKGDLAGFDRLVQAQGFDPTALDRYGQNWFQQSVCALQMKTKVSDSYQEKYGPRVDSVWAWKPTEAMDQALATLAGFWARFDALGVPRDTPCSPERPPRMSKITGKPVRSLNKDERWPIQAALPGERLDQHIARLVEEERLPPQTLAVLRAADLQRRPALPSSAKVAPSRSRRRI